MNVQVNGMKFKQVAEMIQQMCKNVPFLFYDNFWKCGSLTRILSRLLHDNIQSCNMTKNLCIFPSFRYQNSIFSSHSQRTNNDMKILKYTLIKSWFKK